MLPQKVQLLPTPVQLKGEFESLLLSETLDEASNGFDHAFDVTRVDGDRRGVGGVRFVNGSIREDLWPDDARRRRGRDGGRSRRRRVRLRGESSADRPSDGP